MPEISQKSAQRRIRRDRGTVLLTERDRQVLIWIIEQYAVRFDDVCFLLGREAGPGAKASGRISESAARQVVARWQKAGWAASRKMLVHEPAWVWVTAKGLHELGYNIKPYVPTVSRIAHLHAINDVRLRLAHKYPDYRWFSERRIRTALSYEKGATLPHLPDGYLRTPQGTTIAIEVELTPKKRDDVRLILLDLLRSYHEVWYFVQDATISVVTAAQKELEPALAKRISIVRPE